MMTPLLQYVGRFDGGGEITGFREGGYEESWPWSSQFVGFPSLYFAPSGEQLALPVCWRGTSLSTTFCVFGPMFFSGHSVVVDVEGVRFRPRVFVVDKGIVAICIRISSQEYVYDK